MSQCKMNLFGEAVCKTIDERLPQYEFDELYGICTALDPRFKLIAFSNEASKSFTRNMLLEEMLTFAPETFDEDETDTPAAATTDNASIKSGFWSSLKRKINLEKERKATNTRKCIEQELDLYFEESVIETEKDPFSWWRMNQVRFPIIARVAQNRLFIPCTSVASERIFSKIGYIISDRRASLKPENAEMLVFLAHNVKSLDL